MISPDGDEEGDKDDVEGREPDEAIRMATRSTTDVYDDWYGIGPADGALFCWQRQKIN